MKPCDPKELALTELELKRLFAEELTSQEVFDIVATHLLKQGHQSIYMGICRYHDCTNGDRCAVGALIRDHEYSINMESLPLDGIALPQRLIKHKALLRMLQLAHDRPSSWKCCGGEIHKVVLHNIASAHGLNTKVLE